MAATCLSSGAAVLAEALVGGLDETRMSQLLSSLLDVATVEIVLASSDDSWSLTPRTWLRIAFCTASRKLLALHAREGAATGTAAHTPARRSSDWTSAAESSSSSLVSLRRKDERRAARSDAVQEESDGQSLQVAVGLQPRPVGMTGLPGSSRQRLASCHG